MKKKGPAIPEKPPHMRTKILSSSQQNSNRDQKAKFLQENYERYPHSNQREVLVAASKSGRERPVEKRQREPAKLLAPITGKKETRSDNHSTAISRLAEYPISERYTRFDYPNHTTERHSREIFDYTSAEKRNNRNNLLRRPQPVILIPHGVLTDKRGSNLLCAPLSYGVWMQKEHPKGLRVVAPVSKPKDKLKSILASATSPKARSSSVARSGSLTSQGSSGSESGNETFPKSVLKKQKRVNASNSLNPKTTHKLESKKNVTFNAFATVQLMEE